MSWELGPFSCEDLEALTASVVEAWRAAADRDWSVRAGTLDWSCAKTADHAVDCVFAPALFLASRKLDGYPTYGSSTPGEGASSPLLIEALETATRVLTAVVRDAGPDARAVIWRRPQPEVRGPEDFAPRGAMELLLHAWPYWTSPGWKPLSLTGDPFTDLLSSSGRNPGAAD